MKEKITEILNDETIETTEDRVEKLAKELALLVIPKDKYNKLSERVENLEIEKKEIQKKYDDLEKQNMTDEELRTKELAEIEKTKKDLSFEKNRLKAKDLLKSANVDEEQIESLLGKVVSEDETKTLELTNSFIEILNVKVDETKKKIETDLLTGTQKPDFKPNGNETKEITLEDFKNMSYGDRKKLYSEDTEKYNELIKQI